jgi:hypothetical protein
MLDCNSAEWCILAYLYDLSCNCNLLRSRDKFSDLKRLFSSQCEPSNSTCSLSDKKFGADYIANPKKKVDPLTIKLLIENPQNQVSILSSVSAGKGFFAKITDTFHRKNTDKKLIKSVMYKILVIRYKRTIKMYILSVYVQPFYVL